MSLRASSRSSCASGSSARPTLTAAALSRCTAAVLMISTAGTSAMSRVALRLVGRRNRFEGASADSLTIAHGLPLLDSFGLRAFVPGTKVEILPPALTASSRLPGRCTPLPRAVQPDDAEVARVPHEPTVGFRERMRGFLLSSPGGDPPPGRAKQLSRGEHASAIPERMTGSAFPRSASLDPTASRSASSASRMPCALRRKPTWIWLRLPRTPSRRSPRSWTSASSSTKLRRRPRRPGATRRTPSSKRFGSVSRSTSTTTRPSASAPRASSRPATRSRP